MKLAGIIGGIGPESTIDYYRLIVASYRERTQDGSYPPLVVNSIDLQKLLGFMEANQLPSATDYLSAEVRRLHRAGADFVALAANSPHIVFDDLRRQSPVALLSIVEVTCQAARVRGLKCVGLLGTRFTMQGRFYPDVFTRQGITLVMPALDEQTYIHEKYMGELIHGVFLPETRRGLLAVIERLRIEEGIEGVILAGTELPLILRDVSDAGIPFLDTTMLHVEQIVNQILS